MKHSFFLAFFSLFFISACDITGKDTGANQAIGETQVTTGLQSIDGKLSGTGRVIVSESLGQVRGASSFHLRFKLEDEGEVRLSTYGRANLDDSVGIEFRRKGERLEVKIFGGGVDTLILDRFNSFQANGVLEFMIDVHNNHDDAAHLFIWRYTTDNSSDYGAQNAIVNTDFFKLPLDLDGLDFPEWHDLAVKGNGSFWGLDLIDAEVEIYKAGPPKDNS